MSIDSEGESASTYDFRSLEAKWLPIWERLQPFTPNPDDTRPKKYILDMFPYPSGDLHMGHAEVYALGDIVARYWRLRGYQVLHPIGWDSFGLPAENAAIKRQVDPREWTYQNIAQQKTSMKRYAASFDWSRVLHTSDPEYYRWNQWLFLRMYERGLAYRKDSWVNWDPVDQTVLANEQVLPDGTSDRSGAVVVKKKLTQWYFKITDYADRLLDDLNELEGRWPAKVLTMQRNWIGRSEGAAVDFAIEGHPDPVTVFTTRPDTLFGATFMVVAPESDLAQSLVSEASPDTQAQFAAYLEMVQKSSEIQRQDQTREKTGLFLERYAINPVNGERIPVWTGDYVLADYGTGIIMAVPAHDQRDLDFALAHQLPVRVVVDATAEGEEASDPAVSGIAAAGSGTMINSGPLDGMDSKQAVRAAIELLEKAGSGRATTTYRLRDWLISRQRYWGTPIPIVYGENGEEIAVSDDQLPVTLPPSAGLDLRPKGTSPLGAIDSWVNTTVDGKKVRRDADTMDTFVDSSWYFLRFLSPHDDTQPFAREEVSKWAPVDQYVGGVEHAILHLLYARFITKVLFDLGYVDFSEPFTSLLNQGMVILDGAKMSKSKGNVVYFAEELDSFGVDAVRLSMAFAGPPEDDIDWRDVSPVGSQKFLARAWRLARDVATSAGSMSAPVDTALRRATHLFLRDVPPLVEAFKFNVVVARLMELVNVARKTIDQGPGASDPSVREAAEAVAIGLSMFAPYTAEEMWEVLGHQPSVAHASWPQHDPSLLVEDTVVAIIQVNGKVRSRLDVSPTITEDQLREMALSDPHIAALLAGQSIAHLVVRAPKVVSIQLG